MQMARQMTRFVSNNSNFSLYQKHSLVGPRSGSSRCSHRLPSWLGRGIPPPHIPWRLRRCDPCTFGTRYSAPSAHRFLRLWHLFDVPSSRPQCRSSTSAAAAFHNVPSQLRTMQGMTSPPRKCTKTDGLSASFETDDGYLCYTSSR